MEIVWAVLTPRNIISESTIKKIVGGSLYCKPGSKKNPALLDHISEVYHMLNKLYKQGVHWILAGDFNELKTEKILEISPNLRQVVTLPTRYNPPAILDKIITSLHKYYQDPDIKPPLDNDPDKNGKPSDHTIVEMKPISSINNKPARETHEIIYRPITEAGMQNMQEWLQQGELDEGSHDNVHQSAKDLMDVLRKKTNDFCPLKKIKISSDNQPFFTEHLAKLKRRKQREY